MTAQPDAAAPRPSGIYLQLTNGQWLRSCNNDSKPQAVWTLQEAREVHGWLARALNGADIPGGGR